MSCAREALRLYAVTDRAWTGERRLADQVACALEGGVTCVQLREKDLDDEAFLAEAREVARLCKSHGVPLVINDNVEVALACGAEGVHVGQDDLDVRSVRRLVGEDMLVGVSVHTLAEARDAIAGGADYLGVGAMHPTSTKADADTVPREVLTEICTICEVPVVAIGGIGADNMMELAGTGVAGVALVSAIFGAHDITDACRQLRTLADSVAGDVA